MPMGSDTDSLEGPVLVAPPGACDTHMHFYGPTDQYPLAPTATSVPPLATVDDYRNLQKRLGLDRVVIVQPSGYGFE